MNLRRGLLRLWVVFSIAWIVFVGIDAIRYWDPRFTTWESSIRPHLQWAFGPPVAVLLIGMGLWRAATGFRK
jgi:hypothetical protein